MSDEVMQRKLEDLCARIGGATELARQLRDAEPPESPRRQHLALAVDQLGRVELWARKARDGEDR